MAQRTWVGGAEAVAQLYTFTVGGSFATQTFTISIGGTVIATMTRSSEDANGIAQALVASWNASRDRRGSLRTATSTTGTTTGTLTLVADTAGQPFTPTVNTPGGSATFAVVQTTSNSGPNDYGTNANWLEGVMPVAADDVRITGSSSILYGLDQSGVSIDEFIIDDAYGGLIGSVEDPFTIALGNGDPIVISGTGTYVISIGNSAVSPEINGTSTPTNGFGLVLKGTAIAALNLNKGSVQIEKSSTVTLVNQGYVTNPDGDTVLSIPLGIALTTVNKSAGKLTTFAAATTIVNDGGVTTTEGIGAVTNLECNGGTIVSSSSGTVTNAKAHGTGTIDFTRSRTARTVTNTDRTGDGVVLYDPDVVTLTNVPSGDGPHRLGRGA